MVEWFNEWQSTPDLLGMDLENQLRLLGEDENLLTVLDRDWYDIWSEKEKQELNSWLFFFMSMYQESWLNTTIYKENQDYWNWLETEVLEGNKPEYGLNRDMVMAMVENYQSNFAEEFERGGHLWWDWNFVFLDEDEAPTYPRLFGYRPRRKFESLINWTTNPFEVKQ